MHATLRLPPSATGRLIVTGVAAPQACAPGETLRLDLQLGRTLSLTWEETSGPLDPPTPVGDA